VTLVWCAFEYEEDNYTPCYGVNSHDDVRSTTTAGSVFAAKIKEVDGVRAFSRPVC
jgi:hypothetical protein